MGEGKVTAKTTKEFPTLAVMGVLTGIVLEERGFGGIHEVFDFFYPGIMTLGVAAMSPKAAAEVKRQLPEAPEMEEGEDYRVYAKRAIKALGKTVSLTGPHDVNDAEIGAAFDDMAARVRP